ncbi:nucleoside deaminase [Leptobacterium flavescens]|uniref:Nucleoside deaminase n=1 Tax=Leptobacterium flavescens TaxID=472055 RepID=A0A6P0UN60_9FLAO|nr:nucleoside deaminase [Leptobacterium flavescens]NER14714.1 nucleoside deaminase [Leptobacterium flavescens]
MERDEFYMKRCIELGEQALESGNPPVGALIVHKDIVIGEGIEAGKSSGDITLHAEILAVKDAVNKGHASLLSESVMYTTHEPCIMCSYVLRHHKMKEVAYGLSVDHIGGHTSKFDVLNTQEVPKWGSGPVVRKGVSEQACQDLHNKFLTLINNS